jgi:hypothetical protein
MTSWRWISLALWGLSAAALGQIACSSTPKLQGSGGACTQVGDCEKGLVCAEHRCSKDTSLSGGTEAAPTQEGGTGDDAAPE